MTEKTETRLQFECEIKADGGQGVIRGLASTFGGIDSYGDRIERGAFAGSVALIKSGKRKLAMLDHHNMSAPVGVWTSIRETERGLEVEGKLTLEVQRARELYALAKDGALGGMSIGFRSIRDEYDSAEKIRILKEIDLFEVSLVAMPANAEAVIESVRSADDIRTIRDFERALVSQLGFSRNAAKSIAADGFKGDARDEPPADLDNLRDAVAGLMALSAQLKP